MNRVGIGQDSHRIAKKKKPLVLGGVIVAQSGGFESNSDGDVIIHSLCNALSSAIGGDSISTWSDAMCDAGIADSKKYIEIIQMYSDPKTITNKYLEEINYRINAFNDELNIEIVKGIAEHDKGEYLKAIKKLGGLISLVINDEKVETLITIK